MVMQLLFAGPSAKNSGFHFAGQRLFRKGLGAR